MDVCLVILVLKEFFHCSGKRAINIIKLKCQSSTITLELYEELKSEPYCFPSSSEGYLFLTQAAYQDHNTNMLHVVTHSAMLF